MTRGNHSLDTSDDLKGVVLYSVVRNDGTGGQDTPVCSSAYCADMRHLTDCTFHLLEIPTPLIYNTVFY